MRSEAEVALRSGSVSNEDARQLITSSLEEIGHMSAMVEQMLDLARSGRQRRGGALRRLDLAVIARDAAGRMARQAEERGVHLSVEAAGEAPVRGDALSLQRAVGNVLENALAYTPRGGSVVRPCAPERSATSTWWWRTPASASRRRIFRASQSPSSGGTGRAPRTRAVPASA